MKRWFFSLHALGRQLGTVWAAVRHPRTPVPAKVLLIVAFLYAVSPLDLVPDWVPGLGWLDDLVIVPLLYALAWRLIPADVAAELRARKADTERHVRRFGLVGLAALLLTGGITITFLASALQALVRLV